MTHISDQFAALGNRRLIHAVLLTMIWAAYVIVSGCSSNDTNNADPVQGATSGTTGGAIIPQGGVGGEMLTQTGGGSYGTAQSGGADASVPTSLGDASGDGTVLVASDSGNGSDAQNGPISDAAVETEGGPVEDSGPEPDCTPSDWADPGTVPNPTVIAVAADAGQLGHIFGASKGLADYDYEEEEFFFTGTSPAYTSRMVVHRPKNPANYSGTVFMEWYNVTGGIDFAPAWALDREYFMRAGHVHVGVSAQLVGANALKNVDPERYAQINHPGDAAASAIFSQAAMAIHSQAQLLLGPCMPVRAVIGSGQSQSAVMLTAYVDDMQPVDRMVDGFLLHSGLGLEPASNDPDVPVLVVFTMNEGNGALSEGPNYAKWVVAGATHNDANLMARGDEVQGDVGVPAIECADPVNDFPAWRVYNAAYDWLHRWVRNGEKPPSGIPLQTAAGGVFQLDEYGNVMGGIRIQDIEVPIATYSLENAPANPLDLIGSLACRLGGAVIPFTEQQLLLLYPTHDDYVAKYAAAADKALADGYLLQEDYEIAIQEAQNAPIPN